MKEGSSLEEPGHGSVNGNFNFGSFHILVNSKFFFFNEDENECESMDIEDGLVEEYPVPPITVPPIIASTSSISPESQPSFEENCMTVPTTSTPVSIVVAGTQSNSTTLPINSEENSMTTVTTAASTPVSIVVAATQSNSTTLPMTSRGGEVFRRKAEVS
jgi:hypothetical protein